MLATIPSQLLYIAAQFASTDIRFKPNLALINITHKDNQITIRSTDGFRAFRCTFKTTELYMMSQEELNVPASVFKKRIPKGKYSIIHSDHVRVMNNVDECIIMNPMQPNTMVMNKPTNPLEFTAEIELYEVEYKLEYLLMPINKRN